MAEYTPTTNIVRAGWVIGHSFPLTTDPDERANEFDRWLAAHDAEVARHAEASATAPKGHE